MTMSWRNRQQSMKYGWLLGYLFLNLVDGFAPTVILSGYGALGTSHTTMTQAAIEALDIEFFEVPQLTFSMTKARDEIAAANADTDVTDEHNAPSHFDGESFKDGQDRLISLRKQTKTFLKARNGIGARQTVGQALHTLQDFYSHTNWIEMGHREVNRDILGLETGAATLHRPDPSTATCQHCKGELGLDEILAPEVSLHKSLACQNVCKLGKSPGFIAVATVACAQTCPLIDCSNNLVANGLTSGYYSEEGEEYKKPGPHKCSHGGPFDRSADGLEGINKDTNFIILSPHFFLHDDAVRVATEATKQYIREFREDPEITQEDLQLLLGVGPSVAFAIDTTGSMKNVIAGVTAEVLDILKHDVETEDEPSLYVLSQIQDPATNLITTTIDTDKFDADLASLRAAGGEDCPELAMSAIQNALDASDSGGVLFVYTDAAAKDIVLAGGVAATAKAKRIKVFPFLFPSKCSSSAGFDYIASASGGQLFSDLSTDEAEEATKLADGVARADGVDIMSVESGSDAVSSPDPDHSGDPPRRRLYSLSENGTSYSVPVDTAMSLLSFSLSGNDTRLIVSRPGGGETSSSDSDVTQIKLSTGSLLAVDKPSPGRWTATVSGSSNYSLSVSGVSPLHLSSFDFVEVRGHRNAGWFPITSNTPNKSSTAMTLGAVQGNFSEARFELRTRAGEVIAPLNLTVGTGKPNEIAANIFYGNVSVPDKDFVVYLVGKDGAGMHFQRVLPATFEYFVANVTGGNSTGTVTSGSARAFGLFFETLITSVGLATCVLLLFTDFAY